MVQRWRPKATHRLVVFIQQVLYLSANPRAAYAHHHNIRGATVRTPSLTTAPIGKYEESGHALEERADPRSGKPGRSLTPCTCKFEVSFPRPVRTGNHAGRSLCSHLAVTQPYNGTLARLPLQIAFPSPSGAGGVQVTSKTQYTERIDTAKNSRGSL